MKQKTIVLISFVSCLIMILSGCTTQQDPQPSIEDDLPTDLEDRSIIFTQYLKNEDFDALYDEFDETLKDALSKSDLEQSWQAIIISYGELQDIQGTYLTQEQGYDIVYVASNFSKKGLIDIRYVYNNLSQLAGFQFTQHQEREAWSAPDYSTPSQIMETNYSIGVEPYVLSGTLTTPLGDGPFPVVLMLSGSGQNDRDETFNDNKPFKDIAWGLASLGVATFRFDKRSLIYGQELQQDYNATIEEEYIEDALYAMDVLETIDSLNLDQLYLLGHSLGATVSPEIARRDSRIDGIILMAIAARDLEDITLAQYTYLYNLDGNLSTEELQQLEIIRNHVDIINNGTPTYDQALLGVYPAYWYALHDIAPLPIAQNLSVPMFLLQGSRDYQVTPADDFSVWQQQFNDSERVSLKLYESLNHLFMAGEGVPSNLDYLNSGHVDEQVVLDISYWIQNSHTLAE